MQNKDTLKSIREGILDATQEDVIRQVRGLSLSTYVRAEGGNAVTYGTATKILQAINALAKQKGVNEYTVQDLELNLY